AGGRCRRAARRHEVRGRAGRREDQGSQDRGQRQRQGRGSAQGQVRGVVSRSGGNRMSPRPEPKSYFEHTGSRYTYKVKLPDKFVIAAEVKAIGDDPLMLHKVRILDPETGEQIGGDL